MIASLDCGTHRALISEKYTNLKESAKLIRRDEVLLLQLRVEECRLAGKFRKRIALVGSDLCRWCRREEETICHLFTNCKSLAKLRRTHDVLNPTILCSDGVKGLLFFQSALQLLQNNDDEHMEELVRNEELENAITAGAVTVRRRNFVRQEECEKKKKEKRRH